MALLDHDPDTVTGAFVDLDDRAGQA